MDSALQSETPSPRPSRFPTIFYTVKPCAVDGLKSPATVGPSPAHATSVSSVLDSSSVWREDREKEEHRTELKSERRRGEMSWESKCLRV
nr:hypothetical protein Iba_scaffold1678884CG0010 [Ipomoea batatas]